MTRKLGIVINQFRPPVAPGLPRASRGMFNPSTGKFDVERHLLADQPPAEMRSRAARGAAFILLFQGCKFGLLFGVNIILARLLAPEDFGLVAVVTSVTASHPALAALAAAAGLFALTRQFPLTTQGVG